MAFMQWDKSFSVKIAEIDKQHKKLFDIINELYDMIEKGGGKDLFLGAIVNKLLDYAATHFTTEEKYFDRYRYPEAETHKKEHAEFVRVVTEFKNSIDKGRKAVSPEVMVFMKNWLNQHIMTNDFRYGPFLSGKGVK